MNISIIAFTLMAVLTILAAAATVAGEMGLKMPELVQTGDSSLSPRSVNWLATIAFSAALLVCLI